MRGFSGISSEGWNTDIHPGDLGDPGALRHYPSTGCARLCGAPFRQPTAEQAGRITLNPAQSYRSGRYLAVPGLILAVSSLFGGGMLFGWAKPVPVSFGGLRRLGRTCCGSRRRGRSRTCC